MANLYKIEAINQVIKLFFETNPGVNKILAKDLMPEFIMAGIFSKDHRSGLPIRKLLRELDQTGQLDLIPFVLPEPKGVNTNWYFAHSNKVTTPVPDRSEHRPMVIPAVSRKDSDEAYVIDLVDEVLKQKGSRRHCFDFLVGDPNRDGRMKKLPVDVFYPELNLVVEYRERQHTEPVKFFDKPHVMTVSGVHRGEQREKYDQRRREVLPRHNIDLIEISYDDFEHNNQKRLLRNKEKDLLVIRRILKAKKYFTE